MPMLVIDLADAVSMSTVGGPACAAGRSLRLSARRSVDAENRVFRLQGYAGQTANATVSFSQFGQPMVGVTPNVLVQPVYRHVLCASVPWSEPDASGDGERIDDALRSTIPT